MTDVLISLVLVSSLDRILGRFKMFTILLSLPQCHLLALKQKQHWPRNFPPKNIHGKGRSVIAAIANVILALLKSS